MKGGPQTWVELEEEPVSVTRACISLDGTRIAAIFANNTLCIYDTAGEVILPPFEVDEFLWSVIFSRDGELLASGGEALRLWNVQTGEEVESFDIDVYSLAFSPDGTCIAAGCKGRYINDKFDRGGSYNIRVINLELAKISYFRTNDFITSGGECIKLLKGEVQHSPFEGHAGNVLSVAYSADGKEIASCSSDDRSVRVWDVSTGESRTFPAHSHGIYSVAFSPDGTKLVSATTLFNLSTGSLTRLAFDSTEKVDPLAFSSNSRFLALGSSRMTCQIWDTSTHQNIVRLIGHTDVICSVAFFPDGKQIMSASEDGTIRVWDVELLEDRGKMDRWQMYGYWIVDPEGEQLCWTPLPFRHSRNTLVIGKCLTIDFSNFVHGDRWVKCREPLLSRQETRECVRD